MIEDEQYFSDRLGTETVVLNYNTLALDAIQTGNYSKAIQLLHKANLKVTQSSDENSFCRLRAMTLNNLGCLYKRTSQFGKALTFLSEALDCERKLAHDSVVLSGTHLNICAIQSHMGNHEKALKHAMCALEILKKDPNLNNNKSVTLVIAFNNAAVEYQRLGQEEEAAALYYEGWEYAVQYLGRAHDLTRSMMQAYETQGRIKTKTRRLRRDIPLGSSLSKMVSSSRTYISTISETPDVRYKKSRWKSRDTPLMYTPTNPVSTLERYKKLPKIKIKRKKQFANRMDRFTEQIHDLNEKVQSVETSYKKSLDFSFFRKVRHNAAIRIQSAFRGFLTRNHNCLGKRKKIKMKFLSKKFVCYQKIYSAIAAFLAKRQLIDNKFSTIVAIAFRTWQIRQIKKSELPSKTIELILNTGIASNTKNRILKTISIVQSYVRVFIQMRRYRKLRSQRLAFVRKIQALLRRKIEMDKTQRIHKYSIFLCQGIRSVIKQKIAKDILKMQYNNCLDAQITISKAFRHFKSKSYYLQKKNSNIVKRTFLSFVCRYESRSRIKIKKMETKLRSIFIKSYIKRTIRVNQIKRVFKSFIDKKYVKTEQSANYIIRKFKSFMCRKTISEQLNIRKKASMAIQRRFRGHQARKLFKHLNISKERRCLKIQTVFRRFFNSRILNERFYSTRRAILKIQTNYRRLVIQKDYLRMKRAAITIQKNYKGYKYRVFYDSFKAFIYDSYLKNIEESVNKLAKESFFQNNSQFYSKEQPIENTRSKLEWFSYMKELEKPKSIIKIQRFFRRVLFTLYLKQLKFIVKIQSEFRGFLCRLKYENIAEWNASLMIQKKFRTFLIVNDKEIQKEILNGKRKIQHAAEILTKNCRGSLMRHKYLRLKKAAVVISKNYKMYRTRRIYEFIYGAIVLIQINYRKYRSKKYNSKSRTARFYYRSTRNTNI